MLDGSELEAVDDFRFRNRMPSRSGAVREILRRGLIAVGYSVVSGEASSSYGVLDKPGDEGDGTG